MSATQRWREELAGWRIPDEVVKAADESPWMFPRHVFTRRADRLRDKPEGASYRVAWEALDPPGSVLDIGAGGGAASLPLAQRCTEITAVDRDTGLLREFAERAGEKGRTVEGTWPDVADRVGPADVVVCHHVLYNVADLAPFVAALTAHARRLVVVELAERHPLTSLNELWRHFHDLRRPEGPTADDAVAALGELGIQPRVERWRRSTASEHRTFEELVDVTRRRLCLPQHRAGEVAEELTRLGHAFGDTPDLGSSGSRIVTLTWVGSM